MQTRYKPGDKVWFYQWAWKFPGVVIEPAYNPNTYADVTYWIEFWNEAGSGRKMRVFPGEIEPREDEE